MMEKGGSSESMLWEMTPTPLVEAFHVAVWYVLQYHRNILKITDILSWRRILMIPQSTSPGIPTSAGYTEELELLLRLSVRAATWVRVRHVEEKYAEYMHVKPALSRLTRLPFTGPTSMEVEGENGGQDGDEVLLRIFNGIDVAKFISSDDKTTREILRTARVSELRQLAQLQSLPKRKQQSRSISGLKNEEIIEWNDNDEVLEMDSPVACRISTSLGRGSTALPSRKEELIDRILLWKCHETTFAEAWDAVIGPVCRVNRQFKVSVWQICEMLHILTSPCGIDGIVSVMSSFHLVYPPSMSLLFLAPKLLSRQREVVGVHRPSPPWRTRSVNPEELYAPSVPLSLFSSSGALGSYLEALRIHHKLLQATEGRAWRRWNINFVMTFHDSIENGILQLQQQQVPDDHKRQKNAKLLNASTNQEGVIPPKRNPHKDFSLENKKLASGVSTLDSILQQGGWLYEHHLPFLPKHAWFACAELLVDILQYNKKWDLANKWLWRLLDEPVHSLTSPCGFVTLPFYYRFQKRGEWWHRISQNLLHLGRKKEALEFLIERQKVWQEQESAKRYFKVETPESLPVSIQRRARLLRALFPSSKPTSEKSSNHRNVALYNAVAEYHRLHFCYRSDRIAIEGMLANLHKSLRRWTPFPSSHVSFTKNLLGAKEFTIHASRDPAHHTLWSSPRHAQDPCSVEEYVLRWFGGTGHPQHQQQQVKEKENESWVGIHCEGRWIECLARLLLHDAFFFNPDTGTCKSDDSIETSVSPQLVWLSQMQDDPLDLRTPIGFVQRRQRIIEERLRFFEQCPRDTLIEYVKQRCRSGRNPPASASRINKVVNSSRELFHKDEGEVSLLASEEEDAVVLGQLTLQKDGDHREEEKEQQQHGKGSSFSFSSSSPVGHWVDIGDFPLLSLLQSVPQGPLCALLRSIYLSPPEAGYSIGFSGFPDLVLWRETPSLFSETNFKLVEVKSPNDRLSTMQIDVIDTLCRCGFDVSVARVVENNEGMENKDRRSTNQVSSDAAQDVLLSDAEPLTPNSEQSLCFMAT